MLPDGQVEQVIVDSLLKSPAPHGMHCGMPTEPATVPGAQTVQFETSWMVMLP